MNSTNPDAKGWWICGPLEYLIQGPGFDYKVLTYLLPDDDTLVVSDGKDPDHPILLSLKPLFEYLGQLGKLPVPSP